MTWDEYFFKQIELIGSKSKDETKVGAVIVGPNNEIRSTGYNGFPRGVNDDVKERHSRIDGVKYFFSCHAERNAIFNAARIGVALEGCKIYISWYPCADCARAIIQSGIKEVIIDARNKEEKEKKWNERWYNSIKYSREMLKEVGVKIIEFKY